MGKLTGHKALLGMVIGIAAYEVYTRKVAK